MRPPGPRYTPYLGQAEFAPIGIPPGTGIAFQIPRPPLIICGIRRSLPSETAALGIPLIPLLINIVAPSMGAAVPTKLPTGPRFVPVAAALLKDKARATGHGTPSFVRPKKVAAPLTNGLSLISPRDSMIPRPENMSAILFVNPCHIPPMISPPAANHAFFCPANDPGSLTPKACAKKAAAFPPNSAALARISSFPPVLNHLVNLVLIACHILSSF